MSCDVTTKQCKLNWQKDCGNLLHYWRNPATSALVRTPHKLMAHHKQDMSLWLLWRFCGNMKLTEIMHTWHLFPFISEDSSHFREWNSRITLLHILWPTDYTISNQTVPTNRDKVSDNVEILIFVEIALCVFAKGKYMSRGIDIATRAFKKHRGHVVKSGWLRFRPKWGTIYSWHGRICIQYLMQYI